MTATDAPRAIAVVRTGLRVAIVAAVVVAVVLVELTSRSGVVWRLVTFTYQANLLAAVFYAATLLSPRTDARSALRGAVVLYVVVAGLVWNLFLTDYSMGYTPANFLLHVAVPVLALAEWGLASASQSAVRWWYPWAWLTYPGCYVLVALAVLNHAGRRAPYYFLDPGSVGRLAVAINIALLGAAFLVLGYVLAGLGKARVKRPSALRR
ncbi:Pr6Pr family membrane protein [Mycolicibacterium baixiangningiae]|uniref:Pr6Pr family membrane protein n=1 Tax=Mycolicibacterium baixiangningiae TaxID=2761578 RepID=UPI00186900E5|nr:Pr6Pr family membrane protein [Mycolicibacterium baixiangningiae]